MTVGRARGSVGGIWSGMLVLGVGLLAAPLAAQMPSSKPKLPPGVDPGGAVLGLITTGIDPTVAHVNRCLARDGEGEVLGWDMVDRDRSPYRAFDGARGGDPQLFMALTCAGRLRVAPVRVDPDDGLSLAKALAFFSTTPVRVVVLPLAHHPRDWGPFKAAAAQFSGLLILVGWDGGAPGVPAGGTAGQGAAVAGPPGLGGNFGNVIGLANGSVLARAARLLACTSADTAATLSGAQWAARLDVPECQ